MVSEASWLSPSQVQLSFADLLHQSSSPHLQGCSQFYTAHLSLRLPERYFSEQYHPDNAASGLLWMEQKTIWWYLYSSQIPWQTDGPGKTDFFSSTTSKKRCATAEVHSCMGSEDLTPKMDLTLKSADWIPCLPFRWVPNVPWFHSSSTKASQRNKVCTLERYQMVTCLYCCLARTIQHLSKVKHLLKTRLLNTFCHGVNCCNTAWSSIQRSTHNRRGKTTLLTWPTPFCSVFFVPEHGKSEIRLFHARPKEDNKLQQHLCLLDFTLI